MRDIFIRAKSPLHGILPLLQKLRHGAWKFQDRLGVRLVINGGTVKFMDVELEFPEGVGLHYSTPLYWNGPDAYECQTSRAISLLAGKSKLFLDIGSNVGIYAVYVGKKFSGVKIFAFEPIPAIWQKNRRFHQSNHLPDDTVFNLALGDREGPQTIFLPVYETGWEEEQTATLRQDLWQTREKNVEKIEIHCTTLDAFATGQDLPSGLCLLKIDVENYEAAVLRGGKKFIAERRPWIICEILAGQEIDVSGKTRKNNNTEVAALTEDFDYAVFAITNNGFFRMTAQDFSQPRDFKDFLLVPAEKIPVHVHYLPAAEAAGFFQE
jgi:FkbM family methyltransferase